MLAMIVGVLSVPIMILNFASGIVAGIWLAILGEWGLLGIGILFLFTSHWLIGLLLLPMLPVDALTLYLSGRKNPLGYLTGYISFLYTNILIALTFFFAYSVCKSYYHGDTWIGYIPYVLWSWGMALGPWQYMSSREPNNEYSTFTMFCAAAFYLFFLASLFIYPPLVGIILMMFIVVQFIVLPIYLVYVARQEKAYNEQENSLTS